MKKRTVLDQATTPDGSVMELVEHDSNYSIRINGVDLMSTRQHFSEEKLADYACDHLQSHREPRVLIGGLGFGYTLRAALKLLPPNAEVTVAELVPQVVSWNQNQAYPLAWEALADPRVQVVQTDVYSLISKSKAAFDAILLDIDNGPAALVTAGNQNLYQEIGLHQVKSALSFGGKVAIWSGSDQPKFSKMMGKVGFKVNVQRCRANGSKGGWHRIFVGQRVRDLH